MPHAPLDMDLWLRDSQRRPLVMGILNLTPDSFSDGGRWMEPAAAVAHAWEMARDGADLIDVGGESTRPGSQRVSAAEQMARICPVLDALGGDFPLPISIDTTLAEVAEAALERGARIINDISAGREDPRLLALAAGQRTPLILMHMQGDPQTMQQAPAYGDVVAEVLQFLLERAEAAVAAGVERHRIILDPGIGFGKTVQHNLELLRHTRTFADTGFPLMLATSRKGFIARITGETGASDRLFGSAATVAWGIANGAAMVRVHDVGPMVRVARMIRAIQGEDSA